MKHRKYRILSILLLACLALQAVIPGAWAEAAPQGPQRAPQTPWK